MKPAEKIEGGGRRALAYNQATQMVMHGFGDKDIHLIGVILVANGHYAMDMRDMMDMDIDLMGIPGPEGHPNAARGAEREEKIPYIRSETEKSKKPEICPKRRGPRWDLNPRGYEQEIGPVAIKEQEGTIHQATPPCDRGHRWYKHRDRSICMGNMLPSTPSE
jgi:hypothetical protein